jgi:hypothetical protein
LKSGSKGNGVSQSDIIVRRQLGTNYNKLRVNQQSINHQMGGCGINLVTTTNLQGFQWWGQNDSL